MLRECVLSKAKYSQTHFASNNAQILSFFKRIQPTLLGGSLRFRFQMGFCNGFEMTDYQPLKETGEALLTLIWAIYSSERFREGKLHNPLWRICWFDSRWLLRLLKTPKIPIWSSAFGIYFSGKFFHVSHHTEIRLCSPALPDATTLRSCVSPACLGSLTALLHIFPGEAKEGMVSPEKPRSAEASEREASFPLLSVIRRDTILPKRSCFMLLGTSPFLQEYCQSAVIRMVPKASCDTPCTTNTDVTFA